MQINIGCCIDDSYAQHLGVMMTSVLSFAREEDSYKFFLVTDFLSDENKAKIEELKKIKDFELEYIYVNEKDFENVNTGHLKISQFYRFLLFKLESVDKLLYLDADMVCRHDVSELYATDIEGYSVAGAEDIMAQHMKNTYGLSETTTYINSGVMLLNLKETRNIELSEVLKDLPPIFVPGTYGDQDVINYILQDKVLPVDLRWNYCYPFATTYKDVDYYVSLSKNPYIVHWITDVKPWKPDIRIPHMKEEYFKYLKKSPWYSEEFLFEQFVGNTFVINEALRKIAEKIGVQLY